MYRQVFQNIISALLLSSVFCACTKDKPNKPDSRIPQDSLARVLIVCEGSLGNGNASLSVYQEKSDSLFNDVYTNVNGQSLGDVFQSVCKINQQYFLSINNSDKIVVIDSSSWKQKASLNISKPRNILDIGNHRAYVGSLFSRKIYVINTQTFTVEKEINMPYQNAEGMILHMGNVYVCCWDTACNKLYQIDPNTHVISDSILLATNAPQSILRDKGNQLWIMGGNAYKGRQSSLCQIDPTTKKTNKSFLFEKGIEAIKPVWNKSADTLYFLEVNYSGGALNNGVFRIPIDATQLPQNAFISCQNNQYFWALGINTISGQIYVGDPKGFVQQSSVTIYNRLAEIKSQFRVGIGVGSFYFD